MIDWVKFESLKDEVKTLKQEVEELRAYVMANFSQPTPEKLTQPEIDVLIDKANGMEVERVYDPGLGATFEVIKAGGDK